MRWAVSSTRVASSMAETGDIGLDKSQVKKATQALFAYQKTKKNANVLLLNEYERISLMVTVWKIPRCEQIIKIALPHGIRPDVFEVCLITRDEPGMSSDQTEKFYKKLLSENGITHITEIIPLQKLKKEYKPFEAKRRLLSNFDMFLSDDRVRRFLPSLLGKHFYKEKRQPTSVSLKGQQLAARLNRIIQGTLLHITNKGCCYSIRVGHTGMKVDDLVENISAVAGVLAEKLPMRWKNVKILHLKSQTSVALPVYTSLLSNVKQLDHSLDNDKRHKPVEVNSEKKKKKKPVAKVPKSVSSDSGVKPDIAAAPVEKHELDEEIPRLVPIQINNEKQKKKSKGVNIHAKEVEKNKEPVESKPPMSTLKSSIKKRKVSDVKNEEPSMKPSKQKKNTPMKPSEQKKNTPMKPSEQKKNTPMKPSKAEEDQDSVPIDGITTKTPKKVARKSVMMKLSKSAKKAPQTPKLRQKKKMKALQSV